MKLSAKGKVLIIAREGEILHVYRDTKGLPTMGVGHLLSPAEQKLYPVGTPITKEFSSQLFDKDVLTREQAIADNVTVPLTQNQYDALVSLIFNIGVANFKKSTVLRRLNQEDYAKAANAFLLWNEPPEIRGRRAKEFSQFKIPYTKLAPDPKPVITTSNESDTTGGGGTQTTPKEPPSVFSNINIDNLNDKATKLGTVRDQLLSWKVAVPAKSLGWFALLGGFFESNKYFFIVGFGLVIVAAVLLYFTWRKKRSEKNGTA